MMRHPPHVSTPPYGATLPRGVEGTAFVRISIRIGAAFAVAIAAIGAIAYQGGDAWWFAIPVLGALAWASSQSPEDKP